MSANLEAVVREQQRHVRGEAGGAEQRHEQRRLVLAVAVLVLQHAGGEARDDRAVADLDSGVVDVRLDAGEEAVDDLLPLRGAARRSRGDLADVGGGDLPVDDLRVAAARERKAQWSDHGRHSIAKFPRPAARGEGGAEGDG